MVDSRSRLLVFVASPADTSAERASLRTVVDEINLGVADSQGLVVELVTWETHSWPGVGTDPQDVINRQVAVPDVLVGIFWKRLGTPSSRASSGSVEEIESALALRAAGKVIEILVYFNEATYSPRESELEQIAGVFRFRRELEQRGLLISAYDGVEDFAAKARRHLTQIIRRWQVGESADPPPPPGPAPVMDQPGQWRDQVAAGHLAAEITPSPGGETYTFIRAVAQGLAQAGFNTMTCNRVSMVLAELLTNVSRHARGAAQVEIKAQTSVFRMVSVTVESTGDEFELGSVMVRHVSSLGRGEREHGLLRVIRLASDLTISRSQDTNKVHAVLYQEDRPRSVLYESPAVAPILSFADHPRSLWIGADPVMGPALSLLQTGGPVVQDLFLGPLKSLGRPWLGIEFCGGIVDTDQISRMRKISRAAFVPAELSGAVEEYFRPMFERRQVLVLANDTTSEVARGAALWASSHGLEFFRDEHQLAARLSELEPR